MIYPKLKFVAGSSIAHFMLLKAEGSSIPKGVPRGVVENFGSSSDRLAEKRSELSSIVWIVGVKPTLSYF